MKIVSNDKIERILRERGFSCICGLDEAGRGALAGPLVAAAVVLPPKRIYHLKDSKLTSKVERDKLSKLIKRIAIAWSVGVSEVEIINRHGIQTATYLAFKNSIESLNVKPDHLLVDFYRVPAVSIAQTSIVFGDKISQSIAAASIIAKTTRDKLMKKLARNIECRKFCFEENFGYGTLKHRKIISESGHTEHHRIRFNSVGNQNNCSMNLFRNENKLSKI